MSQPQWSFQCRCLPKPRTRRKPGQSLLVLQARPPLCNPFKFRARSSQSTQKNRTVVIVGAKGNEVSMTVGEDARNFKQLRVGDLVTLTYVQALALELQKVDNKVVSERVESEQTVRTKLGEKPGGVVQRTIRAVAEVVAVDQKAETITLRGPKQTVELAVNNPVQLKEIKVGNQVEVVYVEAIGLEVTAAKK